MRRESPRAFAASTVGLEDISPSYVLTLQEWRARFEAATERLEELGYDERFRRIWGFYLAFSEAGFAEARIRAVQMVFAKLRWSGKPRAGDGEAEAAMAAATELSPDAAGGTLRAAD